MGFENCLGFGVWILEFPHLCVPRARSSRDFFFNWLNGHVFLACLACLAVEFKCVGEGEFPRETREMTRKRDGCFFVSIKLSEEKRTG